MSEQGWRAFLAADGLDDWAVHHCGASTVFRVTSLQEAARLAVAVADVPGLAGSGAVVTITDRGLSVRLSRDLWSLEVGNVELARAVSVVARQHGSSADLAAVQEVQVAVAARQDE